jgi:hypothetical protein
MRYLDIHLTYKGIEVWENDTNFHLVTFDSWQQFFKVMITTRYDRLDKWKWIVTRPLV